MKKPIAIIITLLSLLGLWYLLLPTIRFGFVGMPMLLFLAGVMLSVLTRPYNAKKKYQPEGSNNNPLSLAGLGLAILMLLYLLIGGLTSTWSAFHAKKYRNLLGEVNIGNSFAEDVEPIDIDKIRIVDQALAHRLGDKVLGAQPSLGSQARLGEFRIQKVKGEFLWVAPLLHSGFFKWYSNMQGTPGYVTVSATNERDVRLVQNIEGQPVTIRIQPEAYGFDRLERHIYVNGYATQGYTDFTFEIDDEGQPYWVVTLFDKTIGFAGENASGVLVVNAESGEIKKYSIEDAPKWVDRIQPESFVEQQLDDWGQFVNGWWNPSNKDKLTTTKGMSLVYDQQGNSYWYTGLTSVGSDEGTVGFVLVNTRNKKTIWYKQVGATEQAAMYSAMGKVQEKGYKSSFPITYNVNGVPTYVVSLKDQAGLIKMIGMVSVQDYSIVAVGNTLNECSRAYKNALNSAGNDFGPQSTSQRYELRGKVERTASDNKNGETFYYLILEGYPQKIFIGTSAVSPELPVSQKGDSVVVSYDDSQPAIIDIVDLDNLMINAIKTEGMTELEEGK